MKPTKLTPKQERFCQEYLIDLNGSAAAVRAGYSKKAAKEHAARALTNVNIQNKLNQLREPLAKSIQITQEMVLNELAKCGFANLQNYFKSDLTPKDLMQVPEDQAKAISSIKRTVHTTPEGFETAVVEFKLHDKIKSLELLGRHLGFFEKDNKQTVTQFNVELTLEEMRKMSDELKDKY